MSAVLVILKREALIYIRDKSYVISSIFRPILWLLFIGYGIGSAFTRGGRGYIEFIFPGMLGMAILFTSIFFGMSIIWDRRFGFLKVMMVAPVPRIYVVIGKVLSGSCISLFQGMFLLLLAPFIGVKLTIAGAAAAALIMFVGSMALTSIGIFIASRMESFEGFNVIMNFIVMPMFFLSGALFPIDGVPTALRWAVYANPVTYFVDMLRVALGGKAALPIAVNLAMICVFTVGTTLLAGLNFERNKSQ